MSLPKQVKVAGYSVDLLIMPQAEIDKEMADQGPPGNFKGFYANTEQKIGVSKGMSVKAQARTLLHELMHLCICHGVDDSKQEEALVTLLEERVSQLIKDNPKVIKYLQENL